MVGVDSNKDAIVGQVRDDSSFTIFKTGRGLTSEENTSEREGQNVSRFNESGVEGNRWIEKGIKPTHLLATLTLLIVLLGLGCMIGLN